MSPFLLIGAAGLTLIRLFALAGGGGSGGGGGGGGGFSGGGYSGDSDDSSGGSSWVPVIFILLIYVVAYVIFSKKSKQAIARGGIDDAKLDSNQKLAKHTFIQFQHDWSAFNLESMRTYMTDYYYRHNQLMMGALKLAARQNQVDQIQVTRVDILNLTDNSFTAALSISAFDITNDTRTNKSLFAQSVSTKQYYKFQKQGDTWLLDGVDTETADPSQRVSDMQKLADAGGYFYSLDWGWLLLPTSGQLFKGGKFGASDINNHVIGVIGKTIFQLYTYTPYANSKVRYLVAQTAVPKEYGNIYVRPNKLIDIAPNGLTKVSTEWGDFNKKYDVFASDMERVTSFELLNPSFMEKLEGLPFHMSIEVADNTVYLYSSDSKLGVDDYQAMLNILKDAFKEMRM